MGSDTKNPAHAGFFHCLLVAGGHGVAIGNAAVQRCPRAALLGCVDDADELAVARTFLLELDVPFFLREQRVVTADTDVHTGVEPRTALPNDDIASDNFLAAVDFDA